MPNFDVLLRRETKREESEGFMLKRARRCSTAPHVCQAFLALCAGIILIMLAGLCRSKEAQQQEGCHIQGKEDGWPGAGPICW